MDFADVNFKSLCLSCQIEGVMGLLKDVGLLKPGTVAKKKKHMDFYAIKWAMIGFLTGNSVPEWEEASCIFFSLGQLQLYFFNRSADKVKSKVLSGSESEVSS